MGEQELFAFAKWLQTENEQLSTVPIDQVVNMIIQKSQTPEGQQEIMAAYQAFQQASTEMFKRGGKLDYAVRKMKSGGCKSKKKK